ncbi:hypothetical protein AHAS_Ahas20G0129200 [Arachis hypogaea]
MGGADSRNWEWKGLGGGARRRLGEWGLLSGSGRHCWEGAGRGWGNGFLGCASFFGLVGRFCSVWFGFEHPYQTPSSPYLRENGFGDMVQLRDFVFDNSLITAFVEPWRPETCTFHLPWGECTITLQNVAYHLVLRTNREPVGGCLRDFQTWH